MQRREASVLGILLSLGAIALFPVSSSAAPPVVDAFVASPAVPVPGQVVRLTLSAHDPDCATTCTSGCGLYIRSDLLAWNDSSGRASSPFANSTPSVSGSPWSATVDWTAPPADGSYTVTAQVADSGSFMCGGRQTTMATLSITVSSVRAPAIDSFDVSPAAVNVGGIASLSVVAHDPDNRPLTYEFSADAGTISHASPSATTAQWTAPSNAGTVIVRCRVTAPGAPSVSAQKSVEVSIGSYNGLLVIQGFSATRTESLPDDRIAMVDGRTGALKLANRSGGVAWSRTQLSEPVGIAYFQGDLWVLERRSRTISRWSLTGTKRSTIPIVAVMPSDLAASDATGELLVADPGASSVLIVDPASGAVKRTIGTGLLVSPTGITVGGSQVAVSDAANRRVYLFDLQGTLQGTLGDDTLLVRPQAVTRDSSDGTWIAVDSFSGEVHVIDPSGSVRGTLAGFGEQAGQLINPIDVTFLPVSRTVAVSTLGDGVRFYSLVSTSPAPLAATAVVAADRPGDDGGAIQVSWSASPDDPARVTGYYVERDNGGDGVYTRLGLVQSGTTSYLDARADVGGCHVYRVVATTGMVETPSGTSSCVASLNDLPPGPPAALAATALTPQSIGVTWSPAPAGDLASYALLLQWPGGSRTITFNSWEAATELAGLTPDVEYTLALRAVDTAGNLSQPQQTLVRTWPDEAPAPVTVVDAKDAATGGTLTVTWSAAEAGRVPVDHFVLELVPQQAGWPSAKYSSNRNDELIGGLVNELGYVATVTPYTPWGRAGEPRSSSVAVPSAPVREIPVLSRAGREGSAGFQDSAGVAVRVPFAQEARTVRFLYRAFGSPVELLWNGKALGDPLPDTGGAWVEAGLVLPNAGASTGRLDVRNYAFPSPTAEVAVKKLDLVPLPPGRAAARGFDTVIDTGFEWQETRSDLQVEFVRSATPDRTHGVAPARQPVEWTTLSCLVPRSGVCRDPFLPAGSQFTYGLAIASPAGWRSDAAFVQGEVRPPRVVPPVTDLLVSETSGGWQLEWTPISFRSQKSGEVAPVPSYRVYRTDGVAMVLVTEVPKPPVRLSQSALQPDRERFVVRSVDDAGRESE